MIKIGFDAKHAFGDHSGLGNYSRSTIELLSKHFPDNDYSIFSAFDNNVVNFGIPKGVKIIHPKGFVGSLTPSIWRICNMAKSIRDSRIDIFHGLSNMLPFDIRTGGAKSVVTIHDLIFMRYPNLYSKTDRAFYQWAYRKSCENADMIIAISNQTKEDIVEFWNIPRERISVVYQGCNPIYYEKVDQETRERVKARYNLPNDYILSVGTIEERKNLLITLYALGEGKIDIPLVACGRWTPYVDKLKEYAESKGISDRVHFIHDCWIDELPAIYQMATATVFISLFEGFGIPIIESLCSGVPVITSRGGVFDETGGGAALQVGTYDLDELIELLKKVISDQEYRKDVIEKGYIHAEKFRDNKIADKLMSVYNRMM